MTSTPASFFRELPEPFICVACGQEQIAKPYTRPAEFRPPLCICCSRPWNSKQRIPGMTRGDHRQMQRLAAITEHLASAAGQIEWKRKNGTY